jgi:hypothetical protein
MSGRQTGQVTADRHAGQRNHTGRQYRTEQAGTQVCGQITAGKLAVQGRAGRQSGQSMQEKSLISQTDRAEHEGRQTGQSMEADRAEQEGRQGSGGRPAEQSRQCSVGRAEQVDR